MKTESLEIINRLSEVIGASGEYIIGEYAVWYVVSSLTFISLGLAIIITALRLKLPDSWDISPLFIKGVMLFVGALFIACNLPDLFAPEAISIHRLLADIRG
jgi:predicted membrane channel-forming protein YqfA (hemolysin III family)